MECLGLHCLVLALKTPTKKIPKPEEESRSQGSRPRTQKIQGQGQGQPFRGQTLSRPRTEILEAKDQIHRRKCSAKKGLQKFFRAIFKKGKQKSSSQIFRKVSGVLLHNFKNEQIPIIARTDANAYCTIWRSSDIKSRGENLLAYCVSADLNFCYVDNKPTFRTKRVKKF